MSGSRQNVKRKEKPFFRAKNQHMRLKNAHTTEIRAQTSREYKKEVNKQFRKGGGDSSVVRAPDS